MICLLAVVLAFQGSVVAEQASPDDSVMVQTHVRAPRQKLAHSENTRKDDGVWAYFPFDDENNGDKTVDDKSGNGHNAATKGSGWSPVYSTGHDGSGKSLYLSSPSHSYSNEGHSWLQGPAVSASDFDSFWGVEFWVKPVPATHSSETLFCIGHEHKNYENIVWHHFSKTHSNFSMAGVVMKNPKGGFNFMNEWHKIAIWVDNPCDPAKRAYTIDIDDEPAQPLSLAEHGKDDAYKNVEEIDGRWWNTEAKENGYGKQFVNWCGLNPIWNKHCWPAGCSARGKMYLDDVKYLTRGPSPAPTPMPTPVPTPFPTPQPTPQPTPWPEALADPQAKASGELGFHVEDANAFVSDPNALASVEEAVAVMLGVSSNDVTVIRYKVGNGDWIDVAEIGLRLREVGYWVQALSKGAAADNALVVDYEVMVENAEAAAALADQIQTLTPTDVAVALTWSITKNKIEHAGTISADEINIATPVVSVPTPAPTPEVEDGDLDGKSADNVPEEEKGKKKKKKGKQQASCFPGDAVVQVSGRGHVLMSEVSAGDSVLTKPGTYELVLEFMHHAMHSQPAKFLTVVHELGKFRATANHIVFANAVDMLVANVLVGDHVFVGDAKSVVLSVKRSIGSQGMFAPLTHSGTIVVDDVLASTYAGSSATMSAPHGTAHAIAFPARVVYALQRFLGGSQTQKHQQADVEELHPHLLAGFGPLCELQSWLLA